MVRIWMNHWFSTAYNIVNLIKQDDPEFFVIGSNENVGSPIRTVCDEWYHEPTLKDDTYVDYCVEFCREHYVDVFLPEEVCWISANIFSVLPPLEQRLW